MLKTAKETIKYLKRKDSDGLIRHSFLMMFGAQIVNVCNLLFQLISMRLLSNAEYGVLGSMLSIFGFSCFSVWALSRGVTHYTAILKEQGKARAIMPLAKMVSIDIFITMVVLFGVLYLVRSKLCHFFNLDSFLPFALMFGAVMFLTLHGIYNGILQGLQSFKSSTISSVFQGVSRFVFLLIGLIGGLVTTNALSAHMFSYAFGLGVCVWFVVRIISRLPKNYTEGDRITRRIFYGYSFLYLLAWVSFALLMNLDLLVVKHYFDAETAGIFAKIVVLGRMAIFLPLPVASALFPKVVTKGESTDQTWRVLIKGTFLVGLIVFLVVIIAGLFATPILRIMHVPEGNNTLFIGVLCSLVPLSFVFLLLSYELAQRRFIVIFPLIAVAITYTVLLYLFHSSLWEIVVCLGGCSIVIFICLLVVVLRDRKGRG